MKARYIGLVGLSIAAVAAAEARDPAAQIVRRGVADSHNAGAQVAKRGAITGHIRLNGKLPGNPVIRMGMDPMCAKLNTGKRTVQETVVVRTDGSLANVFVRLQGSFPPSPVPAEPVTIDQRACIYIPRVVGARVGQMLHVRNSDELLHNVHAFSARGPDFNVGQPKAGIVSQFRLTEEEIMLRVTCDIHRWMTAFIGVVRHPYFATSGPAGTYTIDNVPPGTYTIQTWHERYGALSQTVRVTPGLTTTVDFAYTGSEKPGTALDAAASPLEQFAAFDDGRKRAVAMRRDGTVTHGLDEMWLACHERARADQKRWCLLTLLLTALRERSLSGRGGSSNP